MKRIQLIALDIDGTLTNDRKEITPLTLQALLGAEKKGIRLVLASARPSPGLFSIRDRLRMSEFGGILMSYNGGRITDCEGNILSEISMDADETGKILRFLETLPVTAIIDDGRIFYVKDRNGYKVDYECWNNGMECIETGDLARAAVFPLVKILLAVDPEKILEVQKRISVHLPPELTVVRTAAFYLEIIPRKINKGQGLLDICRYLGIDAGNTVAFGDSENDIPMIRAAGVGVAMGNAEQAVREAAGMTTLSNNEDGIAYALKKLEE